MKLAIGSDHAGFELKEKVKRILEEWGHEIIDFGTDSIDSVDYSDFAIKVARAVASNEVERGIAICWTGNGVTIASNKIDGIRAAMGLSPDMAMLSRSHNNSNVLTLASKYVSKNELREILKIWLETEFEGGRHARRLSKIPNSGMTENQTEK
ncbi:MAG: ribose 5-phosphate isomerase B [candidate division Zixibacteria bacterium]